MKQYYVEGFFIPAKPVKKKVAGQQGNTENAEFFRKAVWANDTKEALKEATNLLNGGRWRELPKISDVTEEKKMRKLMAPELPGLEKLTKKRR